MGRDEQEIMGKMEQIILMQKLEKLKNNCLIMIENLSKVLGHLIFGLELSIR